KRDYIFLITSPISVILVSSGSRGNKLLFRYPFQRTAECASSHAAKQRNRYAQNTTAEVEDHDGDSRYSLTHNVKSRDG
uniref:Uncharacterized protein n=1 Tax=Hippocampus comes TaxID=109280 RepID=A0A3Q2YQD9_HIPCM